MILKEQIKINDNPGGLILGFFYTVTIYSQQK